MALADAHRALDGLSLGADAGIAVVDHGSRANCADSVDDESIGKRRARGADVGRVEGKSTLADASSIDKNLVVRADVAARSSIVGWGRASRADLAGSVDSSKSSNATAALSGAVVDLVGSALGGADSPLVGEET